MGLSSLTRYNLFMESGDSIESDDGIVRFRDYLSVKNERKMQEYISKEIKSLADRSSVHFGQNYWNTATYAGNLRMIIKSLAEKQGINIKEIDKELQQNKSSWWLEAF